MIREKYLWGRDLFSWPLSNRMMQLVTEYYHSELSVHRNGTLVWGEILSRAHRWLARRAVLVQPGPRPAQPPDAASLLPEDGGAAGAGSSVSWARATNKIQSPVYLPS